MTSKKPSPSSQPPKPPPKWKTTREKSSTCTPPLPEASTSRKEDGFANSVPSATSRASAAPRTASSRPRTTPRSRSRSRRLTRTAARSRARTSSTRSAGSSGRWARATTRSTGWPSVTGSSRTSGAACAKRGISGVGKFGRQMGGGVTRYVSFPAVRCGCGLGDEVLTSVEAGLLC